MNLRTTASAIALLTGALIAAPSTSQATTFNTFANNTNLGQTESYGAITAAAFTVAPRPGPTPTWTATDLWQRNDVPLDVGLGVCSEGTPACLAGGGDVNEVEESGFFEVLRLRQPVGNSWTALSVSSLDSGGPGTPPTPELGTLYWGTAPTPANLFTLPSFQFAYDGTDPANYDLFALGLASATGWDPTARSLFFTAGPNGAGPNDYLVNGATTVPLPAALPMFLAALAGLGLIGRRTS